MATRIQSLEQIPPQEKLISTTDQVAERIRVEQTPEEVAALQRQGFLSALANQQPTPYTKEAIRLAGRLRFDHKTVNPRFGLTVRGWLSGFKAGWDAWATKSPDYFAPFPVRTFLALGRNRERILAAGHDPRRMTQELLAEAAQWAGSAWASWAWMDATSDAGEPMRVHAWPILMAHELIDGGGLPPDRLFWFPVSMDMVMADEQAFGCGRAFQEIRTTWTPMEEPEIERGRVRLWEMAHESQEILLAQRRWIDAMAACSVAPGTALVRARAACDAAEQDYLATVEKKIEALASAELEEMLAEQRAAEEAQRQADQADTFDPLSLLPPKPPASASDAISGNDDDFPDLEPFEDDSE